MFKANEFLFLLIGSGIMSIVEPGLPAKVEVDTAFRYWLSEFEEVAKKEEVKVDLSHISVVFSQQLKLKDNNRVLGECLEYKSGRKVIKIDKEYWTLYATEWDRRELIFHELGHCALGLSHNDRKVVNRHKSIMNSTHLGVQEYGPLSYEMYDHEIFEEFKNTTIVF